jgi:tetratricopeptide (TPR) repeat protein
VKALTEQAALLAQTRPAGLGAKMYALLARALEIDPDYVPAIEQMTGADYFRRHEGLITAEEEKERYAWARRRIMELDPGSAFLDYWDAWDLENAGKLEEAAEAYATALSKDMTDSEAVRLAGAFAKRIGKFDASRRLLEHAVAIDPLCFQCLYQLSRTYMVSGDYDRAVEARERYIALGSGGHYLYGLMLLLQGRPQAVLDYVSMLPEEEGDQQPSIKAMAWHSLGQPEKSEAEFARVVASYGAEDPVMVAEVAAWIGDADAAFEWLYKADPRWAALRIFSPALKSLHGDPRWSEFRESIDRSSARLDAIEFDPVMPD